jgi:polyisoprenyl-phosphate glycosyltransferase
VDVPDIAISVVIPVYKEERNIAPFLDRLVPVLEKISPVYEVLFCLDPSPDDTEGEVLRHIQRNPMIGLIVFSRRFGQPAATMAGILTCKGKTCVVIDVDLQDPPELILDLHGKLAEGNEVVYAQRRSRKGETLFKRFVSYVGYALINRMSDVQIPRNTGDFRIMTRKVIEELRRLNESHGFLRGLVAYVGFKQGSVLYDRDVRHAGKGNYNRLTGSLKIGLNGIISFSAKPLQILAIVGAVIALLSFIIGTFILVTKLAGYDYVVGFPTIALLISFLSGMQLAGLGLIGEYVARVYEEVKGRPMYIIDKFINPHSGRLGS